MKTEESIISRKFLNKRAGGAALRLVPIFQGEHPFLVGPMLLLHLFLGRLIIFFPPAVHSIVYGEFWYLFFGSGWSKVPVP